MWLRKPEPKKPEPRRIPIPREHRRRIMELVRDYERAPGSARAWETYLLWEAVAEVIPEVTKGQWSIGTGQPLDLCVIEVIK